MNREFLVGAISLAIAQKFSCDIRDAVDMSNYILDLIGKAAVSGAMTASAPPPTAAAMVAQAAQGVQQQVNNPPSMADVLNHLASIEAELQKLRRPVVQPDATVAVGASS